MAKLSIEWITANIIPKVLRAAIWGSITILIFYYLPLMLYPSSLLPAEFANTLTEFAVISVSFTVIGQLLKGTIAGCCFGIMRALILIAFFFTVSEGGLFNITVPVSEVVVNVSLDITLILLMIVSVNLLDIAKNLLDAINLLWQKPDNLDLDEI